MKLAFEFSKSGNLIYISHLDLSRLFLRVLRMASLRPVYSQGYNPHPKMSLALPLPVGLHSVCELIEFETDKALNVNTVNEMNDLLPEGIYIKELFIKPEYIKKSLASFVRSSSYEIMCEGIADAPLKLEEFFSKESVTAKKFNKKTNEKTSQEIRSLMLDHKIIKDMRGRMLAEVTLMAMPGRTLNPVSFFSAFCEASGLYDKDLSPVITRTVILGSEGKPLKEMLK